MRVSVLTIFFLKEMVKKGLYEVSINKGRKRTWKKVL